MALRSGLGAQLGLATEETYGTYKAPSRFLPFDSESLEKTPNFQEYKGLKAGQMFQAERLHVETTSVCGGDLNVPFLDQGMGIIFNLLTGETVEYKKVEGATKTYEATFKIGKTEPFGKSATIQVGRPDIGGTVRSFSYLGCKIPGYNISIDEGGFMMLALTIAGRQEVTAEALGTAEYDTDAVPFHFGQAEVKVGGSKVGNARNASFAGSTPQPERFRLGSSGLTSQPIPNDYTTGDITMTIDFESLSAHERFTKGTIVETVMKAVGAEIESGKFMTAEVILKASKQITSSPNVAGPDLVAEDLTFKGLDDGTNTPLTIKLITSDTAL